MGGKRRTRGQGETLAPGRQGEEEKGERERDREREKEKDRA